MRSFPGPGHLYDLAVVGAGISGSEAAYRAALMGLDVLLVTTSLDTVYMLAHGKYQLRPPAGTLMESLCRRLAAGGGAVERWALHREAKYALEAQEGLHLLQSNVTALSQEADIVCGVETWEGVKRQARITALCVGSFLGARLEQGRLREAAGRLGEMAYDDLLVDLQRRGVEFDSAALTLDDPAEGPPYRVEFSRFPSSRLECFDVRGLPGLSVAGVCGPDDLSYEEAATVGMELGRKLAGRLRSQGEEPAQ